MSITFIQFEGPTPPQLAVLAEERRFDKADELADKSMVLESSSSIEAELIRSVARGDSKAFATLYDLYSKPLYSFVYRILSDQRETEDVMQEVFLGIWKKAYTFDERMGKPFGWAATLTRNKAIDRLRSRARQHRDCSFTFAAMNSQSTECTGARELHFGMDEAEQIRAHVSALPDDQRHAIELAFFGGLTHIEIAHSLKAPLGTIKARIRRGMLQLRIVLEQYE